MVQGERLTVAAAQFRLPSERVSLSLDEWIPARVKDDLVLFIVFIPKLLLRWERNVSLQSLPVITHISV